LPHAAEGHQEKNARVLVEAKAGGNDFATRFNRSTAKRKIERIIFDDKKLNQFKQNLKKFLYPDAAGQIANRVILLANRIIDIVMKNICAVIPSFNVERTIFEVINKTSHFIRNSHIIIVDDGSLDQTAIIASKTGSAVLQNGINHGKGYSLKRGFQYAINNGFEAIITLDGDLQHDPLEISHFISCYLETDADLILGDRSHDFSLCRWIGNSATK